MSPSCTGSKISARTSLCQAVYKKQMKTNPHCLMLAIATFNSLFFKAIPCKSVQYWVRRSKLHASFCGRVILGLSVKYPRCQNRKKIIHRGLLQPSSQVLFTVVITSTHSGSMALDLPSAEDPVVALQLFSDSHLGTRCWRAPNTAKHLKHDYK